MEHLSMEIFDREGSDSKFANMEEDASISITDTSEIFGSGDVWSYTFSLNIPANAHIFGSAGDLHGARLHEQIDKRKMRLWVLGLPLYTGYLRLNDEVDVDEDGNVDVTFESGQKTFQEMIEGAKANQVPMLNDVMIGMALWRKRWGAVAAQLKAEEVIGYNVVNTVGFVGSVIRPNVQGGGRNTIEFPIDGDSVPAQEYPRMVFPVGTFRNWHSGQNETINCINTDHPYDASHPYCNIALCYQRYEYSSAIDTDNSSNDPEVRRAVNLMPAKRLNSAPCFYVLYWLDCLMAYLKIHIRENQMMEVEDLRRLFFVNTNCAYKATGYTRRTDCRYKFADSAARLIAEQFAPMKIKDGQTVYYGPKNLMDLEESGFKAEKISTVFLDKTTKEEFTPQSGSTPGVSVPDQQAFTISLKEVAPWSQEFLNSYRDYNSYVHEAYASSECFPKTDVSEVINALESGFGMRLLFNKNFTEVRVVLLREVFRSRDVQNIKCDIIEDGGKQENNIRGFRMTYGAGEDSTEFYYKGFADKLPHKAELWPEDPDTHDYSKWDLNAKYEDVIKQNSAFNTKCYVTPVTGNAYGCKVDEEATRYQDLHPEMFEFAGYEDAEDGDCTGEDETIHTVSLNFTPAIMNDINGKAERAGKKTEQRFALFVDEKTMPRRLNYNLDKDGFNDPSKVYSVGELYQTYGALSSDIILKPGAFAIVSDTPASAGSDDRANKNYLQAWFLETVTVKDTTGKQHRDYWRVVGFKINGWINEGYRLYLQDNYEPNDDGISPIETHDWGLTLGIMRGSGGDAEVVYNADSDDGEGNDTWDVKPGKTVTAHSDTCDNYGNLWDYNGTDSGTGGGERISLKLRAEKPNPFFDATQPEGPNNQRYLTITKPELQNRGLCDQFYKEFSYWMRNARVATKTVKMELAQLLAIDKTKRVTIGDVTGFIKKMHYTISNRTGLGNVTFEIMYL